MILHNTTAIIIVKKGYSFLLIKRADKLEKGYWAVPGGHVDKGETPYQCAQREAREEVGSVEINKKPVYVFVHDADIGHRHKAHVFMGKVSGRIRAGSDAKAIGWFTLKQMRNMNIANYTKQIINKLYSRFV